MDAVVRLTYRLQNRDTLTETTFTHSTAAIVLQLVPEATTYLPAYPFILTFIPRGNLGLGQFLYKASLFMVHPSKNKIQSAFYQGRDHN